MSHISISGWRLRYEETLLGLSLTAWVLEIDGVMASGAEPDRHSSQWMDWVVSYDKVRIALESALGPSSHAVLDHSAYSTLPRFAPIKERLATITTVLTELSLSRPTQIYSLPLPPSRAPVIASSPTKAHAPSPSTPTPVPSGRAPMLPLTGRKVVGSTASTPSSPDAQSTSRVYLGAGGTEKLRDAKKKVLDPNWKWGERCIRCGLMDPPAQHRFYNCTAALLSCSEPAPILTVLQKATNPALQYLMVVSGDQVGTRICPSWNHERTLDGLCYSSRCPLTHICSLCLSPSHRSFDCDHTQYLPIQSPITRPLHLPPTNPDECYVAHTASLSNLRSTGRVSRPPSASRSVSPTRDLGAFTSAELMPPPAFRTSSNQTRPSLPLSSLANSLALVRASEDIPGPSAPPSSQHKMFMIKDKYFRPIPKGLSLPKPTLRPALPPSSNSIPLSTPIRYDPHSITLSGTPHLYPPEVPASVSRRPGFRSRFFISDFRAQLDVVWRGRLDFAVKQASTIQAGNQEGLATQKLADETLFEQMRKAEIDVGLDTSKWELPAFRKTGDRRFQYTDGDLVNAGLVLMPNYPPAHSFPLAFTPTKDGSIMLGAGGLASPSLTGNHQLAYVNVIPHYFQVEYGEGSMSIAAGGRREKYPASVIKKCIAFHSSSILSRLDTGTSQFIFGFGSNARQVCDDVAKRAQDDSRYSVERIVLSTRDIRKWETGGISTELLLLRNRHLNGKKGTIGPAVDLFGDRLYDGTERLFVSEDQKERSGAIMLSFTLICNLAYSDRCIVLHSSDHMTLATDVPARGDISIGSRLDFSIILAEDLYFGRFETGLYHPQLWRFARRKLTSILAMKDEEIRAGLSGGAEAVVVEVQRVLAKQGKRADPNSLYGTFATIFEDVEVEESISGVSLDHLDPLAIVLAASQARTTKSIELNRSHASTPNQGPSRSRASSVSSTRSASNDTYRSVCECGVFATTPYQRNGTGILCVVTEVTVSATGKHKPTRQKGVKEVCLTGIPTHSREAATSALFRKRASTKLQSQEDIPSLYRTRIADVYNKYGQP